MNRFRHKYGSPSIIKDIAGKLLAGAQNLAGIAVNDEPVKEVLAIHTFAQLAIGSYKILIAAADARQNEATKQISQTILYRAEARAKWLNAELEAVTKRFFITNTI